MIWNISYTCLQKSACVALSRDTCKKLWLSGMPPCALPKGSNPQLTLLLLRVVSALQSWWQLGSVGSTPSEITGSQRAQGVGQEEGKPESCDFNHFPQTGTSTKIFNCNSSFPKAHPEAGCVSPAFRLASEWKVLAEAFWERASPALSGSCGAASHQSISHPCQGR